MWLGGLPLLCRGIPSPVSGISTLQYWHTVKCVSSHITPVPTKHFLLQHSTTQGTLQTQNITYLDRYHDQTIFPLIVNPGPCWKHGRKPQNARERDRNLLPSGHAIHDIKGQVFYNRNYVQIRWSRHVCWGWCSVTTPLLHNFPKKCSRVNNIRF